MSRLWSRPRSLDDLAGFVAAVRREQGLTQDELASAAGVPRRFVNELENGHATIYATRLFALLRELGVSVTLDAGEVGGAGDGVEGDGPALRESHSAPPERRGEQESADLPVSLDLKGLGW